MSHLTSELPTALYTGAQCRALDRAAISTFGVPGFQLMQRAGRAAFAELLERWPQIKSLSVVCGAGNNGGDGFVIASLAQQHGLAVQVLVCGEHTEDVCFADKLSGEALDAWQQMQAQGVNVTQFSMGVGFDGDVIVDALLGIGLSGDVRGLAKQAINAINKANKPVLAVDIPSGLCSDTGSVLGEAVTADVTVTFIAVKQGLLTHQAVNYVGDLLFSDLQLPEAVYETQPISAFRTINQEVGELVKPRALNAHKGSNGHVLIVAGGKGMGGAGLMCTESALRSGAGLVTLVTHPDHVTAALVRTPEAMVVGVKSAAQLCPLIDKADVIVIGPGLGVDAWGQQLLQAVLQSDKRQVIDADALTLMSDASFVVSPKVQRIVTPHPGEAGRVLNQPIALLQENRFEAVDAVQRIFGGIALLKGAGTLISDGDVHYVCDRGSPAMAVGGMGDILAGIIGALWAQGLTAVDATRIGAHVHGLAGEKAEKHYGQRGVKATDLVSYLPNLLSGR
ncbi:MAG: NAD(P)H-hydrate dehydratase [Pontibacterium sp.]